MLSREKFVEELRCYIATFYFKRGYAFRDLLKNLSDGLALREVIERFEDHVQVYDKGLNEIGFIRRLLQAQQKVENYPLSFMGDRGAPSVKVVPLRILFGCLVREDYRMLVGFAGTGDTLAKLLVFDCAMRRTWLTYDARDCIGRYMLSRPLSIDDQHILMRLYVKDRNSIGICLMEGMRSSHYTEETLAIMASDQTRSSMRDAARCRLGIIAMDLTYNISALNMLDIPPESFDAVLEENLKRNMWDLAFRDLMRVRREEKAVYEKYVKQTVRYYYNNLQPLNTTAATLLLAVSEPSDALFQVAKFAYYQDPGHQLKAFLYYSQLKKLDQHALPNRVHIEMLSIARLFFSYRNSAVASEYLNMLLLINGYDATFSEAYRIARNSAACDLVKKACFDFCMNRMMQHVYLYARPKLLLVIAHFLKHGIGCDEDQERSRYYRSLAGDVSLYDEVIEDLVTRAKAGDNSVVKHLWKLNKATTAPHEVRTALLRCYAYGWGVRANAERVNDMAIEWRLPVPPGVIDESGETLATVVTALAAAKAREYDASLHIYLMTKIKLCLMLIGTKKNLLHVLDLPIYSDGCYADQALQELARLTRRYTAQLSGEKQLQWFNVLSDLEWSHKYIYGEASETEGDIISRLNDGKVVSFNMTWSNWLSAHAIQYTFYKCKGEIHLNISNRGANAEDGHCGISIFTVGDITAISSRDKVQALVKSCKSRAFCEATNSEAGDGIGGKLGLTLKHTVKKSPQPSGSCAVAGVQNAVLNHCAIQWMHSLYGVGVSSNPDYAELSVDNINFCFDLGINNDYKPWRESLRVYGVDGLQELPALPAMGQKISTVEHDAVMGLVRYHAAEKQRSDCGQSRCKGALIALHASQPAVFSAVTEEAKLVGDEAPMLANTMDAPLI
ncbi:MAG: hypothetical protein P1U34_09165 [Coxiellaceae bacterium]|nr:hypothetical protein [Coxiellaceae bacterium]